MNSKDSPTPLPGADVVRAALQQALEDYGRRLTEDPARLRAVLNDALGSGSADCRAAVDAVVLAAEQGVVADLVSRRGGAPDAAADAGATSELGRWGLSSETAGWVVATWSTVLRGATSVPADPPADTAAPATTAPPALAETAPPPALAETAPPPDLAKTSPPPFPATALPAYVAATSADLPPGEGEPARRRPFGIHASRAVLVPIAVVVALLALASAGLAGGLLRQGPSAHPQPRTPGGSPSASAPGSPSPSPTPSRTASPAARAVHVPNKPAGSSPPPAVTVPPAVQPPAVAPRTQPHTAPDPSPTRRRTTTTTSHAPAPAPVTPRQPPPPPAAPVAESDTTSYTPLACGSDWCVASLSPAASGTWDKLTVLGATPSAYATAYANGRKISWQPQQNGYATYDIQWYVTNTSTGKRSATATLSVTMQCNSDYECN
jgi:hypothetical protein